MTEHGTNVSQSKYLGEILHGVIAVVQNGHAIIAIAAVERIVLLFKVLQDHLSSAHNRVRRVIFHRLQLVLILRSHRFIRTHIKSHIRFGEICQKNKYHRYIRTPKLKILVTDLVAHKT